MKAILLAAGRGERMKPLTDATPKPLLQVHGKALIEWHLEALARAGVGEVVVNTAWLEERIVEHLGDGARFGLRIAYSREGRDHGGALETAGGLKKALPWLTEGGAVGAIGAIGAFWYVAADVFAPRFEFALDAALRFERSALLGQLWMVPNPPQHPQGDFGVEAAMAIASSADSRAPRFTWSGIALFKPEFVTALMAELAAATPAKLRPYLDAAIAQRRLGALMLGVPWADVGTPQRLDDLNRDAV